MGTNKLPIQKLAIFRKVKRLAGGDEKVKEIMKSLLQDESGVTAIEYGLIAGLMAALLVVVLGAFGDKLKELFSAISDKLQDAIDEMND